MSRIVRSIMSATQNSGRSGLFAVSRTGQIEPMNTGESRYPAVSPDGRWLAFSGLESGNWNLFLRELATGATHRLTNTPCNQIEPAWEARLQNPPLWQRLWALLVVHRHLPEASVALSLGSETMTDQRQFGDNQPKRSL